MNIHAAEPLLEILYHSIKLTNNTWNILTPWYSWAAGKNRNGHFGSAHDPLTMPFCCKYYACRITVPSWSLQATVPHSKKKTFPILCHTFLPSDNNTNVSRNPHCVKKVKRAQLSSCGTYNWSFSAHPSVPSVYWAAVIEDSPRHSAETRWASNHKTD